MEWSPPSTRGILSGFQGLHHQLGFFRAGLGDFLQILGVGIAFGLGFGQGDRHVAAVLDVVAQGLELGFESGDAHRRRTHVHAAARLAEVERHADDADVFGFDVL